MHKIVPAPKINNYRPDIDGLRAIAVLSVFFFHLNPSWIPGGFNGVDIFFVISGYLITGHILKDLSHNKFYFKEFYFKRILRILPALIFMVTLTAIVGSFILLPKDLNSLSYQTITSLISLSNYYFYFNLDTSYFAADTKLTPLLHTWSLAVEEQFYLLFPMLLVFFYKIWKTFIPLVLLGLVLLGLLYSQYALQSDSMFAYYSFTSRVWELAAGGFIAHLVLNRMIKIPKHYAEILGVLGLGVLLFAIFIIDSSKSFPGFNAVYAVFGSAALIFSGAHHKTLVSKFIGNKAFVSIGLVSYSLYLFHWPVFAYTRYLYGEITGVLIPLVILVSFLLTLICYYFVEIKLRYLKVSMLVAVRKFIIVPTSIALVLNGFVIITDGFGPYYFDIAYKELFAKTKRPAKPARSFNYVCQQSTLTSSDVTRPTCLINTENKSNVLLWGDSNAAHFVGMLGEIAKKNDFSFRNVTHSACPPLLKEPESFVIAKDVKPCSISSDLVKGVLSEFEYLIISAQFDTYSEHDDFWNAFNETIEILATTHKIILIGQVPRMSGFDNKCHLKSLRLNFLDCDDNLKIQNLDSTINSKLLSIAKNNNVEFFNPTDYICTKGRCSPYINNKLIYTDSSHLSQEGSIELGKSIIDNARKSPTFSDIKSLELSGLLPWEYGHKSKIAKLTPLLLTYDSRYLNDASNWGSNTGPDERLVFKDESEQKFIKYKILPSDDIYGVDTSSLIDRNLVIDLGLSVSESAQDVLIRIKGVEKDIDLILRPRDGTMRSRGEKIIYEMTEDKDLKNYRIVLLPETMEYIQSIELFPAVTVDGVGGYNPLATGEVILYFKSIFISRQKTLI